MIKMRLVLIFLSGLALTGCSLFKNNPVETIQVVTANSANDGKITRVDVVFVYSGFETMPKTADEWFKGEKRRVLNSPENFKVVTLRIPPGLIQQVEMPSKYGKAHHVLTYVEFNDGEEQPPLDLTRYKNPVIMIEDDHYKLSWRR